MNGVMTFLNRDAALNGCGLVPGIGNLTGLIEFTVSAVARGVLKEPPKSVEGYTPKILEKRKAEYKEMLIESCIQEPPMDAGPSETSYISTFGRHLATFFRYQVFFNQESKTPLSEITKEVCILFLNGMESASIKWLQDTKRGLGVFSGKNSTKQAAELDKRMEFVSIFLGRLRFLISKEEKITTEKVDQLLIMLYDQIFYLEKKSVAKTHMVAGLLRFTWVLSPAPAIANAVSDPLNSWHASAKWKKEGEILAAVPAPVNLPTDSMEA